MTLIPHVDEFACAAHGDCALAAPGEFTVEDNAIVTGEGTDEATLAADKGTGEEVYP